METILGMAGKRPLIVRSSSLLEDNFGTAFAGKYESIYLPNQGEPEDNLRAMQQAMARIYASTVNPNALLYRKSRGLLDYDERMALLIQVVEGQQVGSYYFPQLAGVAYSRNQYRWSPQIRSEDGFLRLVWGLAHGAVDRVGNDYPRLVALSHPTLTPSSALQSIRRYSQQYIDLLDLQHNVFTTLPVADVLGPHVPALRYIAQIDSDGYIQTMHSNFIEGDPHSLILTFDELLRSTAFPSLMRELLTTLESEYHTPVDVEFTAQVQEHNGNPRVQITLIQCRPLGTIKESVYLLPQNVPQKDQVFSGHSVVAGGSVQNIRYVLYVLRRLTSPSPIAPSAPSSSAPSASSTLRSTARTSFALALAAGGLLTLIWACMWIMAISTTPKPWWSLPEDQWGFPTSLLWAHTFSKTCWKDKFTQLPLILARTNSNVNFLKQVLIIYPIGSHPKRV